MPSTRPPSEAERLAEQRADRRRQRTILAVAVLGIVVVVIAGTIGYQTWRTHRAPAAPSAQPTFAPVQITDGKPIVLGRDDAPVTVTLFEDFRCPHCADFEDNLGPTITGLQQDGTAAVELYPMTFVDPNHGSVSAANAMACAASAGRGQQYYAGLWANFGLWWSDQQLIGLGDRVGLDSADFARCVRTQAHRDWVDSISRVADQRKIEQTPTVLINGTNEPDAPTWTPEQFTAKVEAAR